MPYLNKPLKCPRLIWPVLGLVLITGFLFFAKPILASTNVTIYNLDTQGYEVTYNAFGDTWVNIVTNQTSNANMAWYGTTHYAEASKTSSVWYNGYSTSKFNINAATNGSPIVGGTFYIHYSSKGGSDANVNYRLYVKTDYASSSDAHLASSSPGWEYNYNACHGASLASNTNYPLTSLSSSGTLAYPLNTAAINILSSNARVFFCVEDEYYSWALTTDAPTGPENYITIDGARGSNPSLNIDYLPGFQQGTPPHITLPSNQTCLGNNCLVEIDVDPAYLPTQWNALLAPFNVTCNASTTAIYGAIGGTTLTSGSNFIHVDSSYYTPGDTYEICIVNQDLIGNQTNFASSTHLTISTQTIYATNTPPVSWTATSTHNLACTVDEWNSTSSLTILKCITVKTALDIGNVFGNVANAFGQGIYKTFSYIFPFNIPANVKTSFDSASTTTPPTGMSWITPDSKHSLSIPFPDWGGNGTTTITLWGDDIWNSNNALQTIFQNVRNASPIAMWSLFIFFIIEITYWSFRKLTSETGEPDWEDWTKRAFK